MQESVGKAGCLFQRAAGFVLLMDSHGLCYTHRSPAPGPPESLWVAWEAAGSDTRES